MGAMDMRKNSLTEGNVFAGLVRFSIPFLLTNLLQACYGASDLFMVGNFAGSVDVSAVATGGQIMQTITGLAIGLTTGGTVVIAQHYGARRRRDVVNAIRAVLIVFGLFSIVMTLGTICLIGPICKLMQVPSEALAVTKEYLLICAYGILPIVGYNAMSCILRGLGDSQTPLLFMVIACVINVSTDLIFVGLLRQGAAGAAVSTVLAQAVSLLLAGVYLAAKGFVGKYRREKPKFQVYSAKNILSVGVPVALQEGLINISFLIITAVINGLGLVASAAVGVVEKLIVFSMLPTTAFAAAVAAMTAQNRGAGKMERAHQCRRAGIGLALLFGVACFLGAQWNADGLVSLFTRDPAVIRVGAMYLSSYRLDCVLVCFVFCMNSFFSGSDRPVFPLVHSLVATFAVRIPLSYLLSRVSTQPMFWVGFAAPAATLVSLLLCEGYLQRMRGRERKIIPAALAKQ